MDFAGFFIEQINPRSLGLWCIKGTEEFTLEVDCSVPLTHNDWRDLGLIGLVKRRKICFRFPLDLRTQYWIFLKKHTLSFNEPLSKLTIEKRGFPNLLTKCPCF